MSRNGNINGNGNIINPTQLQSQFQSLHTHKTNLQNAIRTTDAHRAHEQQTLQHLRTSYRTLEEKVRLASGHAGIHAKKRTMLLAEIARLKAVLNDDANNIKDLSGDVNAVERERRENKFEFIREMEGFNRELEDALRRFEESGSENLLSGDNDGEESCRVLIQFLERQVKQHEDEHEHDGGGAGAEAGAGADTLISASDWNEMLTQIKVENQKFQSANEALRAEKEKHHLMTERALYYRQNVQMQNTEALGDAELDELERLWEEEEEHAQVHVQVQVQVQDEAQVQDEVQAQEGVQENVQAVQTEELVQDQDPRFSADDHGRGHGHGNGNNDLASESGGNRDIHMDTSTDTDDHVHTREHEDDHSSQKLRQQLQRQQQQRQQQQRQQQTTNMDLFYGNGHGNENVHPNAHPNDHSNEGMMKLCESGNDVDIGNYDDAAHYKNGHGYGYGRSTRGATSNTNMSHQ